MRNAQRLAARRAALPCFADRRPIRGLACGVSPYLVSAVRTPEAIAEAYDQGINFFLLGADLHWPLYEPSRLGLRELLRRPGVRDDIVVAAMSFSPSEKTKAAAFRETLASVPDLGRLDVLIAGGLEHDTFVRGVRDVRALVERGHTRAGCAAACFMEEDVTRMNIDAGTIDLAIVPFHAGRRARASDLISRPLNANLPPLYAMACTHAHLGDEEWQKLNLPANQWRPSWTDYVRYTLTWSGFDGGILELMTAETLQQLKAAVDAGPLDEEELDYLDDLDDLANGRASLEED